MIEYFSIDDSSTQHFECVRLRGSVSTDWCARQWHEVNQQPEGRRHPRWVSCSGCAIGAGHAGIDRHDMRSAISEMAVCARCRRYCLRIIRGYLCVSCYNREREYRIGRNAKGKPPVMHPALFDVCLLVTNPKRPDCSTHRTVQDCTSYSEAVLRVFMTSPAGTAVSVCRRAARKRS